MYLHVSIVGTIRRGKDSILAPVFLVRLGRDLKIHLRFGYNFCVVGVLMESLRFETASVRRVTVPLLTSTLTSMGWLQFVGSLKS